MLNEVQVKMLDKGWWPNRSFMAIHYGWDVKVPYVNRSIRRASKKDNRPIERLQRVHNPKTGGMKTIFHRVQPKK